MQSVLAYPLIPALDMQKWDGGTEFKTEDRRVHANPKFCKALFCFPLHVTLHALSYLEVVGFVASSKYIHPPCGTAEFWAPSGPASETSGPHGTNHHGWPTWHFQDWNFFVFIMCVCIMCVGFYIKGRKKPASHYLTEKACMHCYKHLLGMLLLTLLVSGFLPSSGGHSWSQYFAPSGRDSLVLRFQKNWRDWGNASPQQWGAYEDLNTDVQAGDLLWWTGFLDAWSLRQAGFQQAERKKC